jgi:diguanylate cyclase (GGDEF)-like protein/PAS domain S-box-containing protein
MKSDLNKSDLLAQRENPLLLLVDDDLVILSMLKKTLEKQGYDTVAAHNGSTAVELFQSINPDLVLLDIFMPIMNGYDACEAMRKCNPENTVPIIMLTGLDDLTSIERAFDAGATDFITKPINWSLFSQRLRYALRARDMDLALRKSQLRIRHALDVAMLGYWDWELTNNNFIMPDSVLKMLGIESVELQGIESFIDLVPKDDKDRVRYAFSAAKENGTGFIIEHKIITNDRTERYIYQHCEVLMNANGSSRHALGTIQDITALKRAEDMILHQAYHDMLTDLPNQVLYKERLNHAIKVAERGQNKIGVIMMDIDRFQLINESLGHDSGNEVLVAFAGFLRSFIQQGDTVSRISGNEFAILLENPASMDDISGLIRDIRMSLNSNSFDLTDEKIYLSLSIGVSIYPDDDMDAENLMQHANAAMRKAKAQGGGQECFYTADMNRRVHDRLRMEGDLRHALEKNQLELYYQPQVNVESREIVAMEALVRWNHPRRGVIPPARFIPLAEESGLIHALGYFVLDRAISQTRIWHDKGYKLRVGVNLSTRQFMQKDLIEQVKKILDKYRLEARYVDLEITESIAMQDAESSIQKMLQLKKLGVKLSMDDFGTGYSSLSYLHKFPLDILKIDRTFVMDIEGAAGGGAIALAVMAMAKSMSLEVIAEGVEAEAQYEFLKANKCDIIQGYLISRPLTESEFEKYLQKNYRSKTKK